MTLEDLLRRLYHLRARFWNDLNDQGRYLLVVVTRNLERELGVPSSRS